MNGGGGGGGGERPENFNLQEDFLQCLKELCTCETDLNQSLLL